MAPRKSRRFHRPASPATTQALHRQLYAVVLGGRQAWFDANPTGRVLNRFTRDTKKVDENVPNSLEGAFRQLLGLLGIVGVLAAVTRVFALALLPLLLCYARLSALYRPTGRELERLEAAAASPLLQLFGEALHGAPLIRGAGAVRAHEARHGRALRRALRAKFNLFAAQLWLDLVPPWGRTPVQLCGAAATPCNCVGRLHPRATVWGGCNPACARLQPHVCTAATRAMEPAPCISAPSTPPHTHQPALSYAPARGDAGVRLLRDRHHLRHCRPGAQPRCERWRRGWRRRRRRRVRRSGQLVGRLRGAGALVRPLDLVAAPGITTLLLY